MTETQLYVTAGPSTPLEVLAQLISGGVSGIRINFSHGDIEAHNHYFHLISEAMQLSGKRVDVLGDIEGPKLRIGDMDACVLRPGDAFELDSNASRGNHERVHLPHPQFFTSVSAGDTLLLNDGSVELKVISASPDALFCVCEKGGDLSSRKGISAPGRALKMDLLTEFDKLCIDNGIRQGMNICMLSFIQCVDHVLEAKYYINNRCEIMSKIENGPAVNDISRIADASDFVMVARGDLGVETRICRVPSLQRRVQRVCRAKGVRTVVVTQALEAVEIAGRPSLPEINDIACVVAEGFYGIMLTGEVAASAQPLRAFDALRAAVLAVPTAASDGNGVLD